MAKYNTIEVEGANEIIKALKALGDKAEEVIRPATREGAEIVKSEIERRAPVDEGDLKAHGFMVKDGSMKDGAANAVVTLTDRKYQHAFYLEFGAPNRKRGGALPAHPFIRRAFVSKRAQAAKVVEEALKKALGL